MGFVTFHEPEGSVVARYGDECRVCGGTGFISERHGRDGRGPGVTVITCGCAAIPNDQQETTPSGDHQ